jgi:hypothetical protein
MHAIRRRRASRALLALVFCLALLGPGAAGRAAAGADAPGSPVAGPAAGPGQGLVSARPGRSLVAPAGKRDDRDRPGPAPLGALAVVIATAGGLAAARRGDRRGRGPAAAAAARAPPPLQPAAT